MDHKKLLELLHSHEGPSLDFKQEWYKLDSEDIQTKKVQKNELIKDILSLANGNVNVAGETAYLIIGASDSMNEEGDRELLTVTLDKRRSPSARCTTSIPIWSIFLTMARILFFRMDAP